MGSDCRSDIECSHHKKIKVTESLAEKKERKKEEKCLSPTPRVSPTHLLPKIAIALTSSTSFLPPGFEL